MMEPPVVLKLQAHECETALWQKLSAHYTKHLSFLREQNDAPLTELQTAELRGKIKFCKAFLDLAKELPAAD